MKRWLAVVVGLIGVGLIAWGVLQRAPGKAPAPASGGLFTLADTARVEDVAEPVFSPDGATLAYSLTSDNLKTDAVTSDLWTGD